MERKAIHISFWLAIFVIVCLCAFYSLRGSSNAKKVNQKEYIIGEFSYTYTGALLDGKFNGAGEIVFSGGDRYQGKFMNGHFNGNGVFVSANGWRYEGEFIRGLPSGSGAVYAPSGEKSYEGKFKEGLIDEEGADGYN